MNQSTPLRRRHGFRLSVVDAIVLALGGAATLYFRHEGSPLWWIVAMATGHFFLFCNVFLVWRRWELLWAAVFTMNAAIHLAFGADDAGSVLLWQMPMTLFVILRQIRSPWYHGIYAERLNPKLADYLNGNL